MCFGTIPVLLAGALSGPSSTFCLLRSRIAFSHFSAQAVALSCAGAGHLSPHVSHGLPVGEHRLRHAAEEAPRRVAQSIAHLDVSAQARVRISIESSHPPLPHSKHCRSPRVRSSCPEGFLAEVHACRGSRELHRHAALFGAMGLGLPPCHGHHALETSTVLQSRCCQAALDAAASETLALHLPRVPARSETLDNQVSYAERLCAQLAFLRAAAVAIPDITRDVSAQRMLYTTSKREGGASRPHLEHRSAAGALASSELPGEG